MKTRGVKPIDSALQTGQLDWLVLPIEECPDRAAEERIVSRRFRVPHEPWSPTRAYVRPVAVRRSCHHVLFRQESGSSS